jgi:hypothetical protein
MQEWDPLGVRSIPEGEDDRYVGKAYVMLMDEHANADAITTYLWHTATDYMGLSSDARLAERASLVAFQTSSSIYWVRAKKFLIRAATFRLSFRLHSQITNTPQPIRRSRELFRASRM